ncbi:MAG: phosphotransferase [Muribaculum sp.]|nr:phosphotransferase [Muribaculum sp.]
MKRKEELVDIYIKYTGISPLRIERLPGAGSSRQYFRLWGYPDETSSIIGVISEDEKEKDAFVGLASYFKSRGLEVPLVLYSDSNAPIYFQEDLGDRDLLSYLLQGEGFDIAEKVMKSLTHMQTLPREEWERFTAYPEIGNRLIRWDLNYFKYEFLKPSGINFDESALEDDFERLESRILGVPKELKGFMWRDCQSRNVMVKKGMPYFIDFQGGRFGPCLYDAVSFVWQAKAGMSMEMRQRLLRVYASEYATLRNISEAEVLRPLPTLVVFRLLQVLGAYGFRGLVERKSHFLSSIPSAINNLKEASDMGWLDDYPEIKKAAEAFATLSRFKTVGVSDRLRVQIFSFSYKKGYPEDLTGNGGGFMFDCRAMHNPGRYEEYRHLTGSDDPVKRFLESKGEVQPFLSSACSLVMPAVERYIQRGFTNLQIGFGCTGGRHRSVYCAQHLAESIAAAYPEALVELEHREQGVHTLYNEKV